MARRTSATPTTGAKPATQSAGVRATIPTSPAPNDLTTGDNGNTTWVPAETWKFFTQF